MDEAKEKNAGSPTYTTARSLLAVEACQSLETQQGLEKQRQIVQELDTLVKQCYPYECLQTAHVGPAGGGRGPEEGPGPRPASLSAPLAAGPASTIMEPRPRCRSLR